MKNIINPYSICLHLILFLAILMITCLANTAFALDLGQGEIISRVNLRQAPGLQGKIITGIQRGTIVIVKDRQGDWYRIIVSSETYGYEGWIYGKYLRLFSETASHPAIAIPDDSMEFVTTETDAAIPEQSSPEKSAAWQNTEHPDSGSVPADEPTNSDPAIYTQPPEKLTKKSVNLAAKIKPEEKINYDKEKINKTQSDFSNNDKISKSSDKTISLIKEKEKTPLISDDNNSLKENTGWLRLILKFASVILSCFAILLSYKALQFAKETREIVMQFKYTADQ